MVLATRTLLAGSIALSVAAGSSRVSAEPVSVESRAEIHIHAVEHALHVPVDVLNRARHQVTRIYAMSGVEIVWDHAIGATDSTDLRARRLFLVIVPANRASGMAAVNGSAMGAAVKSSDGHGRLAYIFYNRVKEVAANANADLARCSATRWHTRSDICCYRPATPRRE